MIESIKGRHFFISGGSSGIGRATAIHLARLEAKVTITGRDEGRLQETLALCEGRDHGYVPYDLTDVDNLPKMMADVTQRRGPLHGLFHAAGSESILPINIMSQSRVNDVFKSSTWPLFAFARSLTKKGVVAEGRFSLVTMSSVAGLRGQTGMSHYCAAKGAIDAAVRGLAVELAKRGIRVNSIVSGAVESEMHGRITEKLPPQAIEDYRNMHLLGFGGLDDISNAAVFLLSDASKWITGTQLVVDGGYLCK